MTVVAVSGGFDPLHVGHINLLRDARAHGDKLVVILNNDNWLKTKKNYVFMRQDERAEVLRSIRYVDEVIITKHPEHPFDMSVGHELEELKPNIFANGGDRVMGNVPEQEVCQRLGIKMIYNVGGGKTQSSSWLVKKAKELGA